MRSWEILELLSAIASLKQIWDVFPMAQKNNALVAWTLIKGFKDPVFIELLLSSNEIMTPRELNPLWEQFFNAVPREPSNVIWRNCVRGTGKQPKLLSLIESIFSQRILRKQKTFCLKWVFFFCLLQAWEEKTKIPLKYLQIKHLWRQFLPLYYPKYLVVL